MKTCTINCDICSALLDEYYEVEEYDQSHTIMVCSHYKAELCHTCLHDSLDDLLKDYHKLMILKMEVV